MITNQRILVLGGNGFIGRALARAFSGSGCEVLGIGRKPNTEGLRFYQQCSFNIENMRIIMGDFKPTLCLNAAGSSTPHASLHAPDTDFVANTILVENVLEAIRQSAPETRYIGLSSAAVYGDNPKLPWRETARISPRSPYGYHKACAELLTEEYCQLYGLKTLTLRAFSVYGPGLRKQLFWDIFSRSRATRDLNLFGTGEETRDFIYIDDVVAAIVCFAEHASFNGEILNLASGIPTTISNACDGLLRELCWSGRLHFTGDKLPGSPLRMEADITQSFNLGFQCKVGLNEGLRRTAQWLKTTEFDE